MGDYITIEVGTSNAIEGYREDGEALRYRALDGERIVTLRILGDIPFNEQVKDAIGILKHCVRRGYPPEWIESASSELTQALCEELGTEATQRPAEWGVGIDPPEAPKAKTKKKAPEEVQSEDSVVVTVVQEQS